MAKKTQFLLSCLSSILESQCGVVGPLVRKALVFGKHIGGQGHNIQAKAKLHAEIQEERGMLQ